MTSYKSDSEKKNKRVLLPLSELEESMLTNLAASMGLSKSEVLRRALYQMVEISDIIKADHLYQKEINKQLALLRSKF